MINGPGKHCVKPYLGGGLAGDHGADVWRLAKGVCRAVSASTTSICKIPDKCGSSKTDQHDERFVHVFSLARRIGSAAVAPANAECVGCAVGAGILAGADRLHHREITRQPATNAPASLLLPTASILSLRRWTVPGTVLGVFTRKS